MIAGNGIFLLLVPIGANVSASASQKSLMETLLHAFEADQVEIPLNLGRLYIAAFLVLIAQAIISIHEAAFINDETELEEWKSTKPGQLASSHFRSNVRGGQREMDTYLLRAYNESILEKESRFSWLRWVVILTLLISFYMVLLVLLSNLLSVLHQITIEATFVPQAQR